MTDAIKERLVAAAREAGLEHPDDAMAAVDQLEELVNVAGLVLVPAQRGGFCSAPELAGAGDNVGGPAPVEANAVGGSVAIPLVLAEQMPYDELVGAVDSTLAQLREDLLGDVVRVRAEARA